MKMPVSSRRHRRILLLSIGILLALALYCVAAMSGYGLPCLFQRVTGLLCPGCGNSRAALALLKLDFAAAVSYNPLFPLEFFYLLWVYVHCCKAYLQGKPFSYKPPFPAVDIALLAAIILWWIIRNLI